MSYHDLNWRQEGFHDVLQLAVMNGSLGYRPAHHDIAHQISHEIFQKGLLVGQIMPESDGAECEVVAEHVDGLRANGVH